MPVFIADHDFSGEEEQELSFSKGATVEVLHQEGEWWYGELLDGSERRGWFFPDLGHIAIAESPYDHLSREEKLLKRHALALDMIQVEEDFVGVLQEFCDEFIDPILLQDTPFKRRIMGDPSLGLSLNLLKEIAYVCGNLLEGVNASKDGNDYALSYRAFAPCLSLFAEYTSENAKALNALKELPGRELDEYTKKVNLSPGITMDLCLLLPLSHYKDYKPDLENFVWLTPDDAPEKAALEAALLELIEQTNLVDERIKKEEDSKELLHFQFEFVGNIQIFKPGRRIVYRGTLEKIRQEKGATKDSNRFARKTYHVTLFNDALIYYTKVLSVNGSYKMHKMIDLEDAAIEMNNGITDIMPEYTNVFTLKAKSSNDSGGKAEKADNFRTDDSEICQEWMDQIQVVIDELGKTKQKRHEMDDPAYLADVLLYEDNLPHVDRATLSKRAACLYDFVDQEISFTKKMTALNNIVALPLLSAARGATLNQSATKQQAQQITQALQVPEVQPCLRHIELLEAGTTSFSDQLVKSCGTAKWGDSICVGNLFMSPNMKQVYTYFKVYAANQVATTRILVGNLFQDFYRTCETTLPTIPGTFKEKLAYPKGHPDKYITFLRQLLELTPADHKDHAQIVEAIKLVEVVVGDLDNEVRKKRNFEKLLEIQDSLTTGGLLSSTNPTIDSLASRARTFIKEGDMKKVCRNKNKTYRFWLFNDQLIYGEQHSGNSNKFTFRRAIDLRTCSFEAHDDGDSHHHAIEVLSTEKSFILLVVTDIQRQDWISKVKAARTELVGGQQIEAQLAPVWKPDDSNTGCVVCGTSFGWVTRKHHCRNCGSLVCGEHSRNKLVLQHIDKTQSLRVCDTCFTKPNAQSDNVVNLSIESENRGVPAKSRSIVSVESAKSGGRSRRNAPGPPKPSRPSRPSIHSPDTEQTTDSSTESRLGRRKASIGGPMMAAPPVPTLPPTEDDEDGASAAMSSMNISSDLVDRYKTVLETAGPAITRTVMEKDGRSEAEIAHVLGADASPGMANKSGAPPPPPPGSSSKEKEGGGKAEVPEHLQKYKKVQNMIGDAAARNKMTMDGFSTADIDNFFNGIYVSSPSPPPPPASSASSGGIPEHLKKYDKLSKMISEDAARNKMTMDGFSQEDVDNFFKGVMPSESGGVSGGNAPPPPPQLKKAAPPPPKMGGGNFLDEIKNGPKLRKVEKSETDDAPKPAAAMSFAEQIAMRQKAGLKSAASRELAPAKEEAPSLLSQLQNFNKGSLNKARRISIKDKKREIGGAMGELMKALERKRGDINGTNQGEDSDGDDSDSDSDGEWA